VASLGQSLQTVIIAIAFVNTPIYLRLMRSQVVAIRQMRFVEASLVAGLSDLQTVLRHVIPNALGPVLAQLSVNIGWAILLTAGLSFIGAGVRAADARVGQHDRHGLSERRHRPVVAVGVSWDRAGHHRIRLRPDRLQHRDDGGPGAAPRPVAEAPPTGGLTVGPCTS
jgi:ABC-type phosphate transport system permease subunit